MCAQQQLQHNASCELSHLPLQTVPRELVQYRTVSKWYKSGSTTAFAPVCTSGSTSNWCAAENVPVLSIRCSLNRDLTQSWFNFEMPMNSHSLL